MNETRILEIERRLNLLQRLLDAVQQNLTAAIQELKRAWMNNSGGGSSTGTTIYFMAAQVITAGGNATGVTVQYLVGGTPTTITTSGVVYNQGASATVSTAGKTIFLGANGDGTYIVVSQSC